MEFQHPGVNLDGFDVGTRRIAPAPTAVTGFVGTFPAGSVGRPTAIHSIGQFTQIFGEVGVATDTSVAVHDFFANGGSEAVIVATGGPTAPALVDELVQGMLLLKSSRGQTPTIQVLCIPDMARRGDKAFSQQQYEDLLVRATGFCVQNRILLLVDPNTAGDHVGDIESWLQRNPSWGSPNSALYFPRLHTPEGKATGHAPVAASGAVAGVIAMTDRRRGVWKAPAGLEASVDAVVATDVSDREQSPLNRHGINVIRSFPTLGTIIWGARTGVGAAGTDYRHLPVRRTALFIEHSLIAGLQWVVFEPNGEPLWAEIRSSVSTFLDELWRQGSFMGATASDAFFVRCDNTTVTRADIRRGHTVVQLGFAASRPAEFVVLKIVIERR